MFRALDPYHRIRAIVAALFVLTVLALALMSMHGPRHEGRGAGSSASAVASQATP